MTRFFPTLMATTALALACAVTMAPARAAGPYDGIWTFDVPASATADGNADPACPALRLSIRVDDSQVSGHFVRVSPGEGNVVENGRGDVSAVTGQVQPDGAIATQWQNFHADGQMIGNNATLTMQSECGPMLATGWREYDDTTTQANSASSDTFVAAGSSATSSQSASSSSGNGYNVYFAFDKSHLTPQARRTIRAAVAAKPDNQTIELSLVGKADLSGTDGYNMALSKRRAEAVRDAMVAGGASVSRINVRWVGDRDPPVPTAAGVRDAQNRVVQIALP